MTEKQVPCKCWRSFLAWLRRAFKPPRLHWLILAIIVFLLGILAPRMGIAAAMQFVLVGLGLGALLTWLVASNPPGSGCPRLRRIRIFNQSDRDLLGGKLRRVTEAPAADINPPPPVDLPPGHAFTADSPPDPPFADGVTQIQITFDLALPAGSPPPPPGVLPVIPVSITVPPVTLDAEWIEEVTVGVGLISGEHLPNQNYEVAVLLYSRADEATDPVDLAHWPQPFTYRF
jgi:hypothetical protein